MNHVYLASRHSSSHSGGGGSHSRGSGLMDTMMHAMAWRAGSSAMGYLFRLVPVLVVIAVACWYFLGRRRG